MLHQVRGDLQWGLRGLRTVIRAFKNLARSKRESTLRNSKISKIYHAQHSPLVDGKVFFEAYSGRGILCNPEAIFLDLLSRPEFSHFEFVWSLQDEQSARKYVAQFKNDSRVRFVETESAEYWQELSTSQYLVNNTSFPHAFRKREGQTYLNTWHGTPLKTIGYDVNGGREDVRNVVRNLLMSDFLLSPSEFVTEVMYASAFKLRPIYGGKVIEEGYPRIDRGLQFGDDEAGLIAELEKFNVEIEKGKKLVLIAPTWRGDSPYAAEANEARLKKILTDVQQQTGQSAQVLLKVHQFVYQQISDPLLLAALVDNQVPTNLLLAATDLLVTDFSSIFFDYLPHDRPVIFTMDEASDYELERGSYIDSEELPGAIISNLDDLPTLVEKWSLDPTDEVFVPERRAVWRSTYTPLDDGGAAHRLVNTVFGGRSDSKTLSLESTAKKRIAVYGGGLGKNGITTSLLSFLNNLDFEEVDVTLIYAFPKRDFDVSRVDPRIRILPRVGQMIQSRSGARIRSVVDHKTYTALDSRARNEFQALFIEEWDRMTGNAVFDHLIDYSGYAWFWAALMGVIEGPQKSIWIHNDLQLETNKVVNGRRPHAVTLAGLFSIYHMYDNIVSVSPELTKISERNFKHLAPKSKFSTIENLVDADSVLELAYKGYLPTGIRPIRESSRYNRVMSSTENASAVVVDSSWSMDKLAKIETDIARRRMVADIVGPDAGHVFVTSGRLSPEKNHELLIEAFAIVKKSAPDARLLILGAGPLGNYLKSQVDELSLGRDVTFGGHQANPHLLVAASDTFVFSSNYEGQGLSILEARILKKPIVTVRFNVVDDVVPPGQGVITKPTASALAMGMLEAYAGEIPPSSLDVEKYNAKVQSEIDALIFD